MDLEGIDIHVHVPDDILSEAWESLTNTSLFSEGPAPLQVESDSSQLNASALTNRKSEQ
jgi:hypothetical protein